MADLPSRGEVWLVTLDFGVGHEKAGARPAAIISADRFNHGPAEMVVVVPVTSRLRAVPLQVPIAPPEGGLKFPSQIKCEDVRAVSRDRLKRRLGALSERTVLEVADRLRTLLEL